MVCGFCRSKFTTVRDVTQHWSDTGCNWNRDTWVRVAESKREGHSGRRILAEGYPHLWKSEPMSEEAKEKLRAIAEERKALRAKGVVQVKRRRNV